MKFTINIEGDGINNLRAIFPQESEFLRLTKAQMDTLIDEHGKKFGMSETLRKISTLTQETTLYHVPIGKWSQVYATLTSDLATSSDMPIQLDWTTEVA